MSSTRTHRRLARTATAVDSSAPDGTDAAERPGGPIRSFSCRVRSVRRRSIWMAISHAGEWLAEGIVFAISGWMQLGSPSRRAPSDKGGASRGVCRELGLHRGMAWIALSEHHSARMRSVHDTGLVDLSVVALELAIVLLSALAWPFLDR